MSARCPWRPCPYVAADDADLDTHLREVGDPLAETVLAPFLGGADRPFFERMFSLDHRRLEGGGQEILAADDADLDTHLREVGHPRHQPQGHHTTDEVLRALVRTELAWMLHHLRGEFASLGSTAGLVAQITITVDPDEIPEPAPRPVGPETVAT